MEARRILSFFENLGEDQRPPPAIWHSRKKCTAWIEEHRPGESGGGGTSMVFKDNEIERG